MISRLAYPHLVVVVACAAGCQTYQRQPLALADYAQQWSQRMVDVGEVRAYAAHLAAGGTGEETAFDPSDGLSLHEAEAVALHFNPELRIARAQAQVPLAGAKEAGWWPDPQFEAEVLRFVNRGDRTRFRVNGPSVDGLNAGGFETTPVGYRRVEGDFIDDPWIVGAGLRITVPISGRLAVERDLRWSEYSAAWRGIVVKEWELLTELRAAWFDWSTADQRLAIAREYVSRLDDIAEIAGHLRAAGEIKTTEARVLEIEAARQRSDMFSLERDVERTRLALLGLMGLSPAAPVELLPGVTVVQVAAGRDERRTAVLANHPRLRAVEADYESAEHALRLEIRRQYPDLDIGPSYSFEEGFSRAGLALGLPIPLWNRNRQAIALAAAQREAARIAAEAAVERALTELADAESRLAHAARRRATLLADVAPLVDRQVDDSRTLLDLGEVDVLLLRDALTRSLETKLELLDATLVEAKAALDLQQMVRPRFVTPSSAPQEDPDK